MRAFVLVALLATVLQVSAGPALAATMFYLPDEKLCELAALIVVGRVVDVQTEQDYYSSQTRQFRQQIGFLAGVVTFIMALGAIFAAQAAAAADAAGFIDEVEIDAAGDFIA